MAPGESLELEVSARRLDRVLAILAKRGAVIADRQDLPRDRLLLILRKI